MKYFSVLLVVIWLIAYCNGGLVKRMYKEKMSAAKIQDLETSASGYYYTSASGHPTSYVQFTSNSGPSKPVQVVPVYYVAKPQVQFHQPQVAAESAALTAEEEEGDSTAAIQEESLEKEPVEEGEDSNDNYEVQNGDEGYETEGGDEYGKAQQSAHGEKGNKGYEKKDTFHKGVKGSHGEQQAEGYYKEKEGKKAGHHQSAGHYHQHHEGKKGSEGEKHGEKKYHKKGQKTSGFHNVYHKDEYKKDHSFYDEADRNGFYKKYGNEASQHAAKEGGHKKGGKSDAGYAAVNYGKKGSHDKGHYAKEDAGHKGQKGHEAHHATYSDYANEEGKQGGAEYGYGEGKY